MLLCWPNFQYFRISALKKLCASIDVETKYRKLSYLFQNPERNNGIITESLRQLKLFIHQQSSKMMFHCFFGENLSEFKIAWKVVSLLLELLQNVMKQKDVAFAKVVWIQIANLIKMVQFRCGSKFTVLPMDGKNSDQWRWEDPAIDYIFFQQIIKLVVI